MKGHISPKTSSPDRENSPFWEISANKKISQMGEILPIGSKSPNWGCCPNCRPGTVNHEIPREKKWKQTSEFGNVAIGPIRQPSVAESGNIAE